MSSPPQDVAVHARDEYLLVVGAVKDADPPPFRQLAGRAPKEVVLQFGGTGMLEAEDLAALGVDARHHVPDRPVLARRVHGLKDEEHGVLAGRVVELL